MYFINRAGFAHVEAPVSSSVVGAHGQRHMCPGLTKPSILLRPENLYQLQMRTKILIQIGYLNAYVRLLMKNFVVFN
mgnify:CR=1 FL=1